MLGLLSLVSGLVLMPTPVPHGLSRTSRISLAAAPDATEMKMRLAAARVVEAAEAFGEVQGEAAIMWVREAVAARGGDVDGSTLLDKQLVLFDECLVEESGLCEELDLALTGFELELSKLVEECVIDEDANKCKEAFAWLADQGKVDRAAARVRTAAAKFGAEQEAIAEAWVAEVRANSELDPAALLEQQAALFEECLLDDDGTKCKELYEALGALQVSLGVQGKIVSTGSLKSSKASSASAEPLFSWAQ